MTIRTEFTELKIKSKAVTFISGATFYPKCV